MPWEEQIAEFAGFYLEETKNQENPKDLQIFWKKESPWYCEENLPDFLKIDELFKWVIPVLVTRMEKEFDQEIDVRDGIMPAMFEDWSHKIFVDYTDPSLSFAVCILDLIEKLEAGDKEFFMRFSIY